MLSLLHSCIGGKTWGMPRPRAHTVAWMQRAWIVVQPSAPDLPAVHLVCFAEVQKRAAPVILDEDDCIIQSETGSGELPATGIESAPRP